MGRFRLHSNAWKSTYRAQEAYEELLTRRIEELDCSNLIGAKAMDEANWQPTHYSHCFSCCHLIYECPLLPAMREEFEGNTNYINQYEP